MKLEPGDVVLVRFPFTDLATAKRRPAVIVSTPEHAARHGAVVLIALTSQPQPDQQALALAGWREAGLLKPTWFKPVLATISASLVARRLGDLVREDYAPLRALIRSMIVPEFLG